MRKISLFLLGMVALSLIACSNNQNPENETEPAAETAADTTEIGTEETSAIAESPTTIALEEATTSPTSETPSEEANKEDNNVVAQTNAFLECKDLLTASEVADPQTRETIEAQGGIRIQWKEFYWEPNREEPIAKMGEIIRFENPTAEPLIIIFDPVRNEGLPNIEIAPFNCGFLELNEETLGVKVGVTFYSVDSEHDREVEGHVWIDTGQAATVASTEAYDFSQCETPMPPFEDVQNITEQGGVLRMRFTGLWSPATPVVQAGQTIRLENWTSLQIPITGDLGDFTIETCHFISIDEPGAYTIRKSDSGEEVVITVQ